MASYNYSSRSEKKGGGFYSKNYSYYVTTNEMIANVLEYGKKRTSGETIYETSCGCKQKPKGPRAEMKKRVFDEEANKIIK